MKWRVWPKLHKAARKVDCVVCILGKSSSPAGTQLSSRSSCLPVNVLLTFLHSFRAQKRVNIWSAFCDIHRCCQGWTMSSGLHNLLAAASSSYCFPATLPDVWWWSLNAKKGQLRLRGNDLFSHSLGPSSDWFETDGSSRESRQQPWPVTAGFPYLDKGGTAQRWEWGRERRVEQGIS